MSVAACDIIDQIPRLFDQLKDGRFYQDYDSMDDARIFSEGMRKICPDLEVEQRSTRVFLTVPR